MIAWQQPPSGWFDLGELERTQTRSAPWRPEQLARTAILDAVALVVVLVGWFQTSGADDAQPAVSWLCVGVAGLVVGGVGNAMLVLDCRRALSAARHHVVGELFPRPAHAPATSSDDEFAIGLGMRHYHRPACSFAVNKPVEHKRREALEAKGYLPCDVCEP